MTELMEAGRIEEAIHFSADEGASLTYALECTPAVEELALRYERGRVVVLAPMESARAWAGGDSVGLYGSVRTAGGVLEIAVEKDWACLDKSDRENLDTFPHPGKGRC